LTQTPTKLTNLCLARSPAIDFAPDRGHPLSAGIISHLTPHNARNLHEAWIVTATASSVYGNTTTYHPMNTLDLEADSFLLTQDQPGQWVCYDLHGMRIRPTHYTIRSRNDSGRGYNLRWWNVECWRSDGWAWLGANWFSNWFERLGCDWDFRPSKSSVPRRARFDMSRFRSYLFQCLESASESPNHLSVMHGKRSYRPQMIPRHVDIQWKDRINPYSAQRFFGFCASEYHSEAVLPSLRNWSQDAVYFEDGSDPM
jgi:hypothetical protein